MNNNYYFSIGKVEGNCCYDNNAVVSSSQFTEGELDALYRGETITDEYGDEIYLCEDK